MTEPPRPELERLLDDLAAALVASGASIERTTTSDAPSWATGAVTFAILGPAGVELRLDPRIAPAAVRTPDTAPSPRGPEWVRFNPRPIDPHAVDRLEAWFGLAARRASEPPGRGRG